MMNHGKSRQEPPTLWLLTGKPWQVSPLNPVTCGLVRGLLAMHHSHQARKRQGMTRILQRGRLIQLNQLGHQCEIPAHLSTWLLKIWWIYCDLLGSEKWRPSATATSTHGALAPCCSHQRMLSCVETQEVWVQTANCYQRLRNLEAIKPQSNQLNQYFSQWYMNKGGTTEQQQQTIYIIELIFHIKSNIPVCATEATAALLRGRGYHPWWDPDFSSSSEALAAHINN